MNSSIVIRESKVLGFFLSKLLPLKNILIYYSTTWSDLDFKCHSDPPIFVPYGGEEFVGPTY